MKQQTIKLHPMTKQLNKQQRANIATEIKYLLSGALHGIVYIKQHNANKLKEKVHGLKAKPEFVNFLFLLFL